MTSQKFSTALELGPGGGVAIRLPFDPKGAFGQVRAPVRVTIGQHPPFPTTVMAYSGAAWIGLRNGQIEEMGLHAGDRVDVLAELDDAPREVDVPAELAAALERDPAARAAFGKLSFTHRKEYARWVAEAKREATRQDRVVKTIERLKAGIKRLKAGLKPRGALAEAAQAKNAHHPRGNDAADEREGGGRGN